MLRLVAALCALVTIAPVALRLSSKEAHAERTRLHLPLTRYQLSNGMVVILHEDHELPTVMVSLGFRVGSKDERPGRTGFAHLFEHLMFMGTRRVPDGEFDAIMEAGGGQNNASTTTDRTLYVDTGPSHLLETILWLEADRLSSLPEAMTEKKLQLQRDVVENERREEIENRPYGRAELILPEQLFPPGHPYHHPTIGSHEDLRAARVGDVKAFFRQYYVPANATLILSGDFASDEARKLVDKYFAWLPSTPAPQEVMPPATQLERSPRMTIHDGVTLPRVVLAWLTPSDNAPGDAECDLLAALLGSGKSSRLYQSLVYTRKLAQSVEVVQESLRFGSQLTITATAQPGHTTAELLRALEAELARLTGSAPATERELLRARSYVQVEALHDLSDPGHLAEQLFLFEQRFHDPAQLEERLLGRYDDVTLADLNRVAAKVLHAPHVTLAIEPGAPEKGGE
jgi:predicted Zn-dependent peptidase